MTTLKIQYTDAQNRAGIIAQHTDLILIEEQNIWEGNFLVFSDTVPEPTVVYAQFPKVQFESLESNAQALDERTVGMQAIDDFTLQAQATIDERTVGMQEIDDFTLLQVTDLQQQVDQLKADVAALKGGA